MIAVDYHADLKEVQSDPLLGILLGEDGQDAPFDRLAWFAALDAHCDLPPLLATARNGTGAAVLPLKRGKGGLEGLANWYAFRLKPIVTPGADAEALLAALAKGLARRTHRIVLDKVPDEDGSASLLARAFRKAGWVVQRSACDSNHVLPVNGRSHAEYLASRPGKLRTTIRRKAGKVETFILRDFDAEAWDTYEAIYRQSWKPEEGSPEFLRAFAMAEAAAGRMRFGMAFVEGEPVAAQFWTVEGTTAFIHKLAHREDRKAFSPGTILTNALFQHVIDRDGVQMVDFGTGNDAYKADWMEEVRPRFRLEMYRPMAPANWKPILRGLARGAKRG